MSKQVPKETVSSPEHQAFIEERKKQAPLNPQPVSEVDLFRRRLKTSEECRDILAFSLNNLRARFSDLAVEMEKHSNDHIRDEGSSDRLCAAVEGVCADRIKAILGNPST